jgi:hypothetical protein
MKNLKAVIGDNQYQFNSEGIAKGTYILIMQKGDITLKKKLLIQ